MVIGIQEQATIRPANYSEWYKNLLNGAHHASSPILTPPIFVWHLGIWKSDKFANTKEDAIKARYDRVLQIDTFLAKLFARLYVDPKTGRSRTPGVTRFHTPALNAQTLRLFASTVDFSSDYLSYTLTCPTDDKILGSFTDQNVLTYFVDWYGISVTFRFEFHTEYLTMTGCLDLSMRKPIVSRRRDQVETQNVLEELQITFRYLNTLNRLIVSPDGSKKKRAYGKVLRRLYFSPRYFLQKGILRVTDEEVKEFGTVFADFRGLVLGLPGGKKIASLPAGATAAVAFKEPFWRNSAKTAGPSTEPCKEGYWEKQRQAFWPLITAQMDGVNFADHEVSVSRMLGSRALVATTLGVQRQGDKSKGLPVLYLALTRSTDGRQIGRLVENLSRLGTFRLAALAEFARLRRAGRILKVVENNIKTTYTKLHNAKKLAIAKYPAFDKLGANKQGEVIARIKAGILDRQLGGIGNNMNEVAHVFRKNWPIDDDLEHRIERSHYYANKFRKGVKILRIERLEGFLPYNIFVERRMGAAYEYMALLLNRFERVKANVNMLYQIEIGQRSRVAQVQTATSEARIWKFQKFADAALITALLPYYCGQIIIEKIFGWGSPFSNIMWAIGWFPLLFHVLYPGRERRDAWLKSNIFPKLEKNWSICLSVLEKTWRTLFHEPTRQAKFHRVIQSQKKVYGEIWREPTRYEIMVLSAICLFVCAVIAYRYLLFW
ncbi:MAG TPA: hypothetical protein VGK90_12110 [Rhizomicrobium sp.]